jgi:hypothetical protein
MQLERPASVTYRRWRDVRVAIHRTMPPRRRMTITVDARPTIAGVFHEPPLAASPHITKVFACSCS